MEKAMEQRLRPNSKTFENQFGCQEGQQWNISSQLDN